MEIPLLSIPHTRFARAAVALLSAVVMCALFPPGTPAERPSLPWRFGGETRLPSAEAITEPVKCGDTTDNAAWTLVLTREGRLRLYQTYPLRTARELGKYPGAEFAAVSRGGKFAVAAAREGVFCFDLSQDGERKGPLPADPQEVRALDVSDGGVAALAVRGTVLLYDFPADTAVATEEMSGTACRIRGRFAVFGTKDGSVLLYDLESGKRRFAVRIGVRSGVAGVDVTADGKLVAALLEREADALLLSGEDGSKIRTLPPEGVDFAPGRPVPKDCALSADGSFAAVAYAGKYLLFDLLTGKLAGVVSTEESVQERIRLVGERPTLFCCRTLTFREHQGGIYNALPDEPTLDLTAPPEKAEGVRAVCYAPKADVFLLFRTDGRIERLVPGSGSKRPLPITIAKGSPTVAPGGKRILVRMKGSVWLLGASRKGPVTVPTAGGEVKAGFCGDARFFVLRGGTVDFYDLKGKKTASADLDFTPDFAEGLQGGALFAEEGGRWSAVSLPAGTVTSGSLPTGKSGRVVGLSAGGILVLESIEGVYYRLKGGETALLFRVPLARKVTGFAVSRDGAWIAYRTPAGAFVREVKTARSMKLPQAADYLSPAFSANGRRLYFYSRAGIAAFKR